MKSVKLKVVDGWTSILSGFGIKGKDKLQDFIAYWNRPSEQVLEEDYSADDVCGRIVDEIPNDGTREWVEFTGLSPEQEKQMQALHDILDIQCKYRNGWNWSRLYGGAAGLIVTNIDSGKLYQPLNLKGEGGQIKSITILNRFELNPDTKITADPAHPNFGFPEFYQISSSVGPQNLITRVHHSRIVRFEGIPLPRRKFIENNYWNDSALTKPKEAIRNYNIAHLSSVAAAVDFSVPVLKMKNLSDLVGAGKKNTIEDRVHIMNMCKSIMRMILIDETESLEYLTRTVTGLPEIVSKAEDRLVMASKMPRTKILGESPKGMNGDGKSEDRQWYDLVAQERGRVIDKPYSYLFKLMLEQLNMPATASYKWKALWQESDQEKATTYKTFAEADEIYMRNGVISQTTVQESRFGSEEFGTEITLSETDKDIELTETEEPKEETPEKTPDGSEQS